MVGANASRDNGSPWLHNMDNTQAQFLRELRLLYQRSLRARSLATAARATLNAEGALSNTQQQNQPMEAAAAAADDPCPLQAPPPLLLDLAFAQPTPSAAAATLAAAGAIAGGTNAAPAATQAPAAQPAPVPAVAPLAWQADEEESDDDDDEPPPGMIDSSEAGEEDEGMDGDHEQQQTGFGTWRPQALLRHFDLPSRRLPWGAPAPRYDTDEDMQDADTDNDDADGSPGAYRAAMPAIRRAWQRANRPTAAATQQQQRHPVADIGELLPVLRVDQCRQPAPCSFLQRGVVFEGCQKLTQLGMRRLEEQWTVRVVMQDVDLARGYVSGTMQASNVPGMEQHIETFWEGCVIDDINHTFFTRDCGASKHIDLQHWAKFEGWSEHLRKLAVQHSGRCGVLERHPVIYMRWKEQFFTQPGQQDSGLSIAGFYYIALNRATGQLRGFYYEPNSSPFQELNMTVAQNSSNSSKSTCSAGGVAFGSFSFA